MKRMVKNASDLDNLSDVIQEDGNGASVGGNLMVDGTVIANGEIRGGQVSASRYYLGTEEMPLVKANPTGEATGTLEKIKIGDVAYDVGGGGGSDDREISLMMPYPTSDLTFDKKVYIDDETYNKINQYYYETIKLFFNDGNPIGIFHVFDYYEPNNVDLKSYMSCSYNRHGSNDAWYGTSAKIDIISEIITETDSNGKYLRIYTNNLSIPILNKSKFDDLYKLAEKPTGDGTYVLKATVSGGAVTYTWVAQ